MIMIQKFNNMQKTDLKNNAGQRENGGVRHVLIFPTVILKGFSYK